MIASYKNYIFFGITDRNDNVAKFTVFPKAENGQIVKLLLPLLFVPGEKLLSCKSWNPLMEGAK